MDQHNFGIESNPIQIINSITMSHNITALKPSSNYRADIVTVSTFGKSEAKSVIIKTSKLDGSNFVHFYNLLGYNLA